MTRKLRICNASTRSRYAGNPAPDATVDPTATFEAEKVRVPMYVGVGGGVILLIIIIILLILFL